MEQSNSLRSIDIIGNEKLKGDIHINILNDFDKEIKAGEYFLIYQNQSAVGLGRAIAPAWEWAGTPGALADFTKNYELISAYESQSGIKAVKKGKQVAGLLGVVNKWHVCIHQTVEKWFK